MIAEFKLRRQANVGQALSMLDLAAESELENKYSLLSIAARSLTDSEVARRWIELAQKETDAELRRAMLVALEGIPLVKGYVPLLVDSLLIEQTRSIALQELGRILVHAPDAIDSLIDAYRHQQRTSVKRHILAVLLQFDDPPPTILDFLATVDMPTGRGIEELGKELQHAVQTIAYGTLPPEEKTAAITRLQEEFQKQISQPQFDYEPLRLALIDRLLRKDRFDPKWLRPTEPVAVRRRVLAHLIDHPTPCEEVERVLANDPDVDCRLWAIRALAAAGNIQALLECVRRERQSNVRAAALAILEDSAEFTPALIGTLQSETSQENVELILRRLAPMVGRSESVRNALLSLLGPDLKATLAKSVCEVLGHFLTRELFEIFLKTYETAKEDRIRAAVLQALSSWHEPDERLARLYVSALKSPQREIRNWGARGLILLPMTEGNIPAIGAGADALLEIDYETAVRLAEKIVKIPNPSAEIRAALKKVGERPDDDELRRLGRKIGDQTVGDVDWDQWLRRVSVEHDVSGVFPDIYSAYDSNPKAAREILRTAILDPQCRSHDVSPLSILEFLISKQGLDDDLCRFCLDNAGGFIGFLKLRADFPELKHRIWEVIGKEINPVLLRELLIMIFGSDEAAGEAVRARVVELDSAPGARPWLKFLLGNILWPPAKSILIDAAKRPALMDSDNRKMLGDIVPQQGPGLADE